MSVARAARVLRRGGIVAYPTESVFGLGCDPRNRRAVLRLLRIKRRTADKGLILIAAQPAQLRPYVTVLPSRALETWPGPYTWLVPASARAPAWVRGRHTRIAVRVTAHPIAARLCRLAGMAIVSTSANRSGEHPARRYHDAVRRLGKLVDYVLSGRVGRQAKPTQIADAVSGKILRKG